MRPTVTEQLEGAARILRDVVAPHVADENAREQLGHATAALVALASSWHGHQLRLLSDVRELEQLLVELDPDHRPDPSLPLPDPAALPTVALLETRHTVLRDELSALIERLHDAPADPDVLARRAAVRAQLLRSADRFA